MQRAFWPEIPVSTKITRLQNSRIFWERERRSIFERKVWSECKTARENGERRFLDSNALRACGRAYGASRLPKTSENDCFAVYKITNMGSFLISCSLFKKSRKVKPAGIPQAIIQCEERNLDPSLPFCFNVRLLFARFRSFYLASISMVVFHSTCTAKFCCLSNRYLDTSGNYPQCNPVQRTCEI